MPLFMPEQGKVDLAQGRGSAISPADTYHRPGVPQVGQGLEDLSRSLAQFGGKFTQLADDQSAQQEREDRMKVDFYAQQVRNDLKSNTVSDAQIGTALPQQSATVRAMVAQKLGGDAATEFASKEMERILQDPQMRLNPELMDAELEKVRAQAAAQAKGNPFWGAGFASGVNSFLDKARSAAQSERAGWYEKQQTELVQNQAQQAFQTSSAGHLPTFVQTSPSAQKLLDIDPSKLSKPLQVASALVGMNERENTQTIAAFIKQGSGKNVDPSVTPWCAALVDAVLGKMGAPTLGSLRAADFKNYGEDASGNPTQGDIVVFKPLVAGGSSGHVGFLVGTNPDGTINVLGGNQSNGVTVQKFKASDVVAVRRPPAGSFKDQAKTASEGGTPQDFIHRASFAESSGNANVQNSRSSASGLMQFTDDTWVGFLSKDPRFMGGSREQLLSLKSDPKLQQEMGLRYAQQNQKVFEANKVPVNNTTLYLGHVLDGKNAVKVWKASDGTPVDQVLTPEQMSANPQWKGMSVSELKQWAAQKMGAPVPASVALPNATRAMDRTFGRTLSLDEMRRRDIYADYYAKQAVATGDPRYLDAMPKEWMNPNIQNQFDTARKQMDDLKWHQYVRARQLEEEQRKAQLLQDKTQIIQDIAAGKEVDPRNYANNPESFEYAYQMQQREMNIKPADSAKAMVSIESAIGYAARTGDYSKVDLRFAPGQTPSNTELAAAIAERSDLTAADKRTLMGNLDKTVQGATVASSPEVNAFYERSLAGYLKGLNQNIMMKTAGKLSGFNPEGEGRAFFEGEVFDTVQAWTKEHGQPPSPLQMRDILSKAREATEAHMDKMLKFLENKPDATPAEVRAGVDEKKIEWVKGEDGVMRPKDQAQPETTGTPAPKAEPASAPVNPPPAVSFLFQQPGSAMGAAAATVAKEAGQTAPATTPAAQPTAAAGEAPRASETPAKPATEAPKNDGVNIHVQVPEVTAKMVEDTIRRATYGKLGEGQNAWEWVKSLIPEHVRNGRTAEEQTYIDSVKGLLAADPQYQKLKKAYDEAPLGGRDQLGDDIIKYEKAFADRIRKELASSPQ